MASATSWRCEGRPSWLALCAALCALAACSGEVPREGELGAAASRGAAPREVRPPVSRPKASRVGAPGQPAEDLYLAHHLRWVSGEIGGAVKVLETLVARPRAPRAIRARGALWLAEIAELRGKRRQALAHLERAKHLAGPATPLSRLADDRRARIVSRTPLADVRGPAPGSIKLQTSPQLNGLFRRAEGRLMALHRLVLRPRIENLDSVLRGKQAALSRAVALYETVERQGQVEAKAAARFRIAAMYHHMAEALAFERPPELLRKFARRLTRKLQAQSVAYLSRALSSYRAVANLGEGPGVARWKRLAGHEAQTLARLLGSKRKGRR